MSLENIVYWCDYSQKFKREIFKDISNYEGLYQVSDLGRVKSLNRRVLKSNGVFINFKARILHRTLDPKGYYRVTISKNCKTNNFTVHQLVAVAFLGHKKNGVKDIVDHKNNIHIDNRAVNLQIIPQRQNASKDRFRIKYSSNYLGVTWCKQTSKWRGSIYINGKNKCLGRYNTEIEASEAYQKALQLYNQEAVSH